MENMTKNNIYEHLSQKIDEIRGKTSLRRIAELSGIEAGYFSRLKRGERPLTMERLESIAGALGVNPGELLPESWMRPVHSIDIKDVERVTAAVLEGYEETKPLNGGDYATSQQLAQIVCVYLEEEVEQITPASIRSGLRLMLK